MNEIILVKPSLEYAEQVMQLKAEIIEANDPDCFAGCSSLENYDHIADWLEHRTRCENPALVPEGKVPSGAWLAVRTSDNRVVGMIDLRHHIDHPILGLWGGHIGYTVRPSERGKGYAREMLRLDLENARALGLKRVMVTCSPSNPASERTILACGGIFEKDVLVDGEIIRRYWIEL